MNEPMDEQDGVDLDRLLGRIHRSTDGYVPGALTRKRRARAGAWSVAGVGAVAAAGLVVSGVLTPDDGAAPQAVPVATAAPTAPTPVPTSGGGAVVEPVVFVKEARTAVEKLDLKHMIVSVTTTDGSQHPDEPKLESGVDREFYAGDGTASRWINIVDVPGATTDDSGSEEVKKVVPGTKNGLMTYWYVDPRVGAYAKFRLDVGAPGSTTADLVVEWITNLGNLLKTVQGMTALDGVVSSAPTTTKVDGRPAVCIRLSGGAETSGGWEAQDSDGDVKKAIAKDEAFIARFSKKQLDWSTRTCFDRQTRLPVLHTYSYHYQLDEYDSPSRTEKTDTYAWLPRNATTEKLLEPDLKGLRRVTQHQLGVLVMK